MPFNIRNKLEKVRKKNCNKIISFVLKNRINNRTVLRFIILIYKIVSKGYSYEPEYKDENHHYIPQFILKNFKIGSTGEIYEYSIGNKEPVKKSIKTKAACIKNFNTFVHIKNQKKSLFLEKEIYGLVELCASHIIKDIINNKSTHFTDPEKSILASHTADQYTRTPAFRTQLKNYILFLIERRNIDTNLFSNKHKNSLTNVFLQNSLNIKRKELVEFNLINKNNNRKIEKTIRENLDNLDEILQFLCVIIKDYIAENIFRKHLIVLKSNDPFSFILPDAGVMIYDFDDEYDYFLWPYGWNIKRKSTSLFVPISNNKCLLFSNIRLNDSNIKKEYIKLSISLAYHQKHNYIYSDKNDKYIQNNINNFPKNNHFD